MTEEEKQRMLTMMMRQEEPEAPMDLGGRMYALADQGAPQDQYSRYQDEQQGGGSPISPNTAIQLAKAFGGEEAGAAAGAGGEYGTGEAVGSLYGDAGTSFLGGEAAAGGGEAAGGSAMSTYAAPAAAMAALVYAGEKSGINKEMGNAIGSFGKELGRLPENSIKFPENLGKHIEKNITEPEKMLKFWEWF